MKYINQDERRDKGCAHSIRKRRALLVCPHLNVPGGGGVANYYSALKRHLSDDIRFFHVGSRIAKEAKYRKPLNLASDAVRLLACLVFSKDYDLIHINPSFLPLSIIRDGLLIKLSLLFGRKVLVFFRGWDSEFAEDFVALKRRFFYSTYGRANAFIVLASEFKEKLREWGFKQPIFIETTTVDDSLVTGYDPRKRRERILSSDNRSITLLFMSRVEKDKGVIETIEAAQKLSTSYPGVRLLIAGSGSYIETAKNFVQATGMADRVIFVGYVSGTRKMEVFMHSDVFIFPTYHGEGMPNCVLEAMAFGLPVITRPVGGIKDFFKNGRFGFLTDSTDSSVIASLVKKMITDKNLSEYMSNEASQYALEHFMASRVAKRLEGIYEKVRNT